MKQSNYLLGVAALALCLGAASSGLAYQEGTVTNGGTVAGKVLFKGNVPTNMIVPTKDVEVCGEPREEPAFIVGPDKGVAYAIAELQGVETGKAWPGKAEPAVIDNRKCRFVPQIQAMRPGKITVVNSDPMLHNTHGFYGRRTAFNMALPNQGQRIDAELPRPGLVRVECDAHGWMLGWVYVAETPYYAITGEDGTFQIPDVPPGDYTLVVHQPAIGPTETQVTVKAKETAQLTIELKK